MFVKDNTCKSGAQLGSLKVLNKNTLLYSQSLVKARSFLITRTSKELTLKTKSMSF